MARHWWLTPDGSWYECPMDNFMECAFLNAGYFGLGEQDQKFMLSTAGKDRAQQIYAFMDRMLRPQNSLLPKEAGANAILAQWDAPNSAFVVAFWMEDQPTFFRIMKWLATLKLEPGQRVVLKEWSSQRQWVTSVQQILSGGQFSKNPDRKVTCNRCGENIGKMEVVERGVCPRCGMDLVGPM